MKIKKLTAYLLMSGMILGTMSSDLYTIKAQAVETIEETEDKTPENETPQIPETPEQPETEPENEEVTEVAPVGEIELSAEQFPDQVILTFAGTCDKDGNGSLSEAECMEVEELAMPNAGITDLKGVENFRNLQRVDVSQNAIGDFAPVKDLSSLQILKVNGNPASVLDVTGCSSLKKLYAQNSTFSELHVTGLGSLEEVRIENNHLTDLDLTGLTSLRALSCYGNQLHTLDARPAAVLEVLQADSNGMESLLVEGLGNLKTLHCQNNNLQQISLSGLGALEEFNAANNSLTELIVDEASALKTVLAGNNQLSGEFRFGTAKQVSVENNQITNLIGAEENIAYLNFNNNQLISLKMDSAAPESVYGNQNNLSLLQFGDVSNLKTLYCAENHLAWTESGKALDLQLSPQTIELKRKYDGEKYWTDLNEVLTPQQLQRTEVLMGENSQIASFDKESGKVFYTGPASALEYYFTAGDVGEDEGNARMLVQAKLTEETVTPPQEEKFHVTIKTNDNSMGTVTIDSADGSYKKGEKAEVIAVANEGFRFVNWTDAEGNVISESNPYVFEVTKDLDLTANFEKIEDSYLIYVESPDPQMGTVTMDPANEGNIYKEGTEITVKAEPKAGYEFAQWLEVTEADGEEVLTPVEGAQAEYKFHAESDRVLRAEFRLAPVPETYYRVVVQSNDENMGTVSMDKEDGAYKEGVTAYVKAEAKEGFEFVGWKEKGQTEYVSKDAEYQFKVTKNTELIGEFKAVEVPHVPSAQEILNDILANNKIPSEVKAGTERLVLPEVPEGSKIEIVAVNPEGIIGLDGKVTTPENDKDVIVTIQVTDTNGATAKADVKVLVRGEKADPDPNPNPDPDSNPNPDPGPDDGNNGNDNNGGNDNNSGNNNGGSHNNGSTSGSHPQSVQTGDNANVIMWAVLLVAAVAAVGAVVVIRRKKK
ncbi:leucine-rich repeat domain-containing protein [[Ruminococcus] gnavus]|uniref:InlB B-repeat-containing protein n=1 Tax=Mediterraneibacter gnavus TaxID=33038 RepID=UPI0021086BDD|nr:leucine-rich repeat domain-containing protein [Mediterraneibacter gnavus]MCQ4699569.1 leucine-rich repeat domain-containing protein [Mediterraneibacter gnavus]